MNTDSLIDKLRDSAKILEPSGAFYSGYAQAIETAISIIKSHNRDASTRKDEAQEPSARELTSPANMYCKRCLFGKETHYPHTCNQGSEISLVDGPLLDILNAFYDDQELSTFTAINQIKDLFIHHIATPKPVSVSLDNIAAVIELGFTTQSKFPAAVLCRDEVNYSNIAKSVLDVLRVPYVE